MAACQNESEANIADAPSRGGLQHIDELRQLIERGAADECAEGGQAGLRGVRHVASPSTSRPPKSTMRMQTEKRGASQADSASGPWKRTVGGHAVLVSEWHAHTASANRPCRSTASSQAEKRGACQAELQGACGDEGRITRLQVAPEALSPELRGAGGDEGRSSGTGLHVTREVLLLTSELQLVADAEARSSARGLQVTAEALARTSDLQGAASDEGRTTFADVQVSDVLAMNLEL